jgi:hypothetical protein
MLARDADEPHVSEDAIKRTSLVAAKFAPDICKRHAIARVHSVVRVSAPFIVNAPTKYEKSAKPAGECDQHKL